MKYLEVTTVATRTIESGGFIDVTNKLTYNNENIMLGTIGCDLSFKDVASCVKPQIDFPVVPKKQKGGAPRSLLLDAFNIFNSCIDIDNIKGHKTYDFMPKGLALYKQTDLLVPGALTELLNCLYKVELVNHSGKYIKYYVFVEFVSVPFGDSDRSKLGAFLWSGHYHNTAVYFGRSHDLADDVNIELEYKKSIPIISDLCSKGEFIGSLCPNRGIGEFGRVNSFSIEEFEEPTNIKTAKCCCSFSQSIRKKLREIFAN